jgi:hypothetical protein
MATYAGYESKVVGRAGIAEIHFAAKAGTGRTSRTTDGVREELRKKAGKEMNFDEGLEEVIRFSDQEKMKILEWTAPPKTLFYPGTGKDILRVLGKFAGVVDRFYFNDTCEPFPDFFAELQDTQYFNALLDDPAITFFPSSKKITKSEEIEYLEYTLRHEKKRLRFRFYHGDHTDAMKHMKKEKVKINFLVLRGYGGEGGSNFYDVFKNSYQKKGTRIVKTYFKNSNGYGIGSEWIPVGGWKLFKSVCSPKLVVEREEKVFLQETRELGQP